MILDYIGSALTNVIGWMGEVVTAFVGGSGALQPLLPAIMLSAGLGILVFSIKSIKSLVWGI